MGMISSLPLTPIRGHSYSHVLGNIRNYEKAFSARYEAAYMWFLMQKIHREISGKNVQQKWQLDQRKWESYNRPLKQGFLYILRKGGGRKWKKRFCVLQSDYSLEIYNSEEEFQKKLRPRTSTKYSGYVVAGDVNGYLHKKLELACRDFGYVNPDINAFGKKVTTIGLAGKRPTQHIFCVDHPWRGCVYFAADTAIEKDQWLSVFRDSVRHLNGCQCVDEVGRDAFAFAVEQSVRLQEFYVDQSMLSGTQQEILTDLISAFQSVDCKEVVLPRITGGIVNKHKAWNFILNYIHNVIKGIVTKEYTTWRKVCEERCHDKRQEIIVNLPQLTVAYDVASTAIRDALKECFDPILTDKILPKLPEVINTMSDSLVTPLRATREMFKTLVEGVLKQVSTSSHFANNIDRYFLNTLDFAPRDPEFTCPSGDMSNHISAPLSFLESVFPQTDFKLHMNTVYIYQQQLLDSAVCTFETLCGDSIAGNDGKLTVETIAKVHNRVLKKLDYDIILAQRRFFKSVLLSATMERARDSIEQYCKPRMIDFEGTIPEDLQCFMPINNVFTDVLSKRFAELINPVLNSCLKQLASETLPSYKFRSSSNLSSLSSFQSILDGDDEPPRNIKQPSRRNSSGEPVIVVEEVDRARDLSPDDADVEVARHSRPVEEAVVHMPCNDAENGERLSANMDGETGEWFPRSDLCAKPEVNALPAVKHGDEVDGSDSLGDTSDEEEEFSEEAHKAIIEEALRNGFEDEPDLTNTAGPSRSQQNGDITTVNGHGDGMPGQQADLCQESFSNFLSETGESPPRSCAMSENHGVNGYRNMNGYHDVKDRCSVTT